MPQRVVVLKFTWQQSISSLQRRSISGTFLTEASSRDAGPHQRTRHDDLQPDRDWIACGARRQVESSSRNLIAPVLGGHGTSKVAESGYPGFECSNWFALVGPQRMPPAIVNRLHAKAAKSLASPAVRTKLSQLGVDSIGGSGDELAAMINAEIPRWTKLINELGIKAK